MGKVREKLAPYDSATNRLRAWVCAPVLGLLGVAAVVDGMAMLDSGNSAVAAYNYDCNVVGLTEEAQCQSPPTDAQRTAAAGLELAGDGFCLLIAGAGTLEWAYRRKQAGNDIPRHITNRSLNRGLIALEHNRLPQAPHGFAG